jgi:hypothetical protein
MTEVTLLCLPTNRTVGSPWKLRKELDCSVYITETEDYAEFRTLREGNLKVTYLCSVCPLEMSTFLPLYWLVLNC